MAKSVVVTPAVAAAKTAKQSGNISDNQTCMLQATNAVTGQPFARAFPSYGALEEWLATDASASNLDLTNIRIIPANAF